MSTRSVICVTGNNVANGPATVRLYKHCDGYPTENLRLIANALGRAKYVTSLALGVAGKAAHPLRVDTVVGYLIGEATTGYGMGALIEETCWAPFAPENLGDQEDLEWIYLVDLEERSVQVYGGKYTGERPQEALAKGTVDPLKYADKLRDEFQEQARRDIRLSAQMIESSGFRVNQ